MSLLGAILAGGGSRRFGSPKTLARLHGTPLWKVAAGRLGEVCDEVVAIVNTPGSPGRWSWRRFPTACA